ncbi:DMT family transporter [Ornithinimicrobium humiphilum]|uniref:Threonine/homoserine efflux transporter RhtA n=1 Tax=Ornithinimicrobium humiphilum TaxID=125288 RepID=A0A543KQ77_9MICO|nr:DMT family transporter [Ornithinimicrobium humiphilum]TQM97204.1 threonine/homoserine efflux transporter RhtA [Ornithinimicrobium humiphilum]
MSTGTAPTGTVDPALRTRANLLLVLTSAIWGFGFVAQRLGADHMGAMSFNAARFAIGSLSLLPLIWWFARRRAATPLVVPEPPAGEIYDETPPAAGLGRSPFLPGLAAGGVLFAAAGLQQAGLATTTAGKAGFITGLYIVLVPVLGLLVGHRASRAVWVGLALAVPGLYLLSMTEDLTIAPGDLLVLAGAVFWAVHILVIDHFVRTVDALRLSAAQFAACALLSGGLALVVEERPFAGLGAAVGAVLYGGLFAVGVAYTLQVVAQRHAKASHAALLLSLEAVFGALGGWLLLDEVMSPRMLLGCALVMTGIVVSLRGSEPAAPVGPD